MPELPPARNQNVILEDIADGIPVSAPVGGLPVVGPLTDEELRSAPVPVSGPMTNVEMRATPVNVAGPLTDAQLRAARVQVSTETVRSEQTQNIASGLATGLATGAAALDGSVPVGLWTPAAWTSAAITFQVSRNNGATWADLYDEQGLEVLIPAGSISTTASRRFALNPRLFIGVDRVRVRSGTGAAPVIQAASRDIVLVARPIA